MEQRGSPPLEFGGGLKDQLVGKGRGHNQWYLHTQQALGPQAQAPALLTSTEVAHHYSRRPD